MSCDIGKVSEDKLIKTWASDATEYTPDELRNIINKIDEAIIYCEALECSSEDIIMFRIGVTANTDFETPMEVAYQDIGIDVNYRGMTRLSIDFVKISKLVNENEFITVHYASNAMHNVADTDMFFGISNITTNNSYATLDVGINNAPKYKSKYESVPTIYTIGTPKCDITNFMYVSNTNPVVTSLQFIIGNLNLLKTADINVESSDDDTGEKSGDHIILFVSQFIYYFAS